MNIKYGRSTISDSVQPKGFVLDVTRCEQEIVNLLLAIGIIGVDFTGSVTIFVNQGGIRDYEKTEKGLRNKIHPKG